MVTLDNIQPVLGDRILQMFHVSLSNLVIDVIHVYVRLVRARFYYVPRPSALRTHTVAGRIARERR